MPDQCKDHNNLITSVARIDENVKFIKTIALSLIGILLTAAIGLMVATGQKVVQAKEVKTNAVLGKN